LYRIRLGRDSGSAGVSAVGDPLRLTPAVVDANQPAWMPDSQEILFSKGQLGGLWRLSVAGERPGETQPARLPFVGEDGIMPVVSGSTPGRPLRLVYVRSFSDDNIWRVETSAPGARAPSPPVVSISSTR